MTNDTITMHPPLTPKLIEGLRPREAEYEVPDPAAPGLRLRVTRKGVKCFRWYVTSIRRVVTIGRWSKSARPGFVTLAEARSWLEKLKDAHKAGRLDVVEAELRALRPRPERVRADAGEAVPAPITIRALAEDFLKNIEARRKQPAEVRRTIENELIPAIGDRPVAEVMPREIAEVVEAVVARGAATQAGKVLAHAKQFFRWASGRGDIPPAANPAYPLERTALGVVNRMCRRFLSPDEIVAFWNALDRSKLTPTTKLGLKVILLTGVRSCELLRARWSEIDFDTATWTIPVSSQKLTKAQEEVALPWVVPLAPAAVALFRQLEVLAQGSEWVMACPFDPKARLSQKALVAGMRKLYVGAKPLLSFAGERPTPHDLRRTVRTNLGSTLKVPWDIAERCLNHSLGKIAKTYDNADYLEDRRAALEKWAAYVERLVAAAPDAPAKPANEPLLSGTAGR